MNDRDMALRSNVIIVIIVPLTLNAVTVCNATKFVHESQLDQWHVYCYYNQEVCPPWFYFDWETQSCQCLAFYAAECFNNKAYLFAGFCATLDTDTEILSLGLCPYHNFRLSKLDQYWYTQLPDNVSELNDYMCGPLNRKGRVCSECKDGYGLATTSVGFQYFECSKCAGVWYGVPLFLLLEMFPLTVLYLVILLFQVNITSGSITCFIFFSQLSVIACDRVFGGNILNVSDILENIAASEHSKWFFIFIVTIYDVWNLRFFRNVLPSFCISSGLKPMHISLLEYISVFYPLCLIFLTWVCVELYDRKFRLLMWLWKPFRSCFKGKEYRIDFINAFASFFLLSFTKVMYQAVLFLVPRKIESRKGYCHFLGYTYVVGIDQTIIYRSTEHLLFAVPAAILCLVLNVLPVAFLTLYPIRPFRVCFSKCRLDGVVINTFIEKFYSCYKTGLNGGRDMRSFAGLYFVARLLLFLSNVIASLFYISNNDPFFVRGIILTITALLITLCRPYKKTYMNVLDTILLLHFGLLCHLMSSERGFSNLKILAVTFEVMLMLPLLCCVLFFAAKVLRLQKVFKKLTKACGAHFQKYKSCCSRNSMNVVDDLDSPSIQQVLVDPACAERNYGSIDDTAY